MIVCSIPVLSLYRPISTVYLVTGIERLLCTLQFRLGYFCVLILLASAFCLVLLHSASNLDIHSSCTAGTAKPDMNACLQALSGPYKGEDVREQLEERITEHAAWVETNGSAQLAAYTEFVAARSGGDPANDSSNAGSNGAAAAEAGAAVGGSQGSGTSGVHLDAYGGMKPQSLSLIDDIDVKDLTTDLETRVKGVVRC